MTGPEPCVTGPEPRVTGPEPRVTDPKPRARPVERKKGTCLALAPQCVK